MSTKSPSASYLKLGKKEDLPDILALYKELFDNSYYNKLTEWDEEHVSSVYLNSLKKPEEVCTVLLKQDNEALGAVSFGKTKLQYSRSDYVCTEVAFWIRPEYRTRGNVKKLLESVYYWARLTGCKAVFIGKIKSKNSPEEYIVRKL